MALLALALGVLAVVALALVALAVVALALVALALVALALGALALGVLAVVPLQRQHAGTVGDAQVAHAEGPLVVGIADSGVDLPSRVHVAGYPGWSNREAPGGRRDDLGAHAIVFAGHGGRVAIVVLDLLLIPPGLEEDVRRGMPFTPPDAIVLIATHTHSGPGGYWQSLPQSTCTYRRDSAPGARSSARSVRRRAR